MTDDRFEVGRDLGIHIIGAITEYQDQIRKTIGAEVTVFEIIGVLHMLTYDYQTQLRKNSGLDPEDDQ